MTIAIGPVPTPTVKNAGTTSYTPQLSGGQIYQDNNQPDWNAWNQGWNEGFNNPTSKYTGSSQDYGKGYLIGQQEYYKRQSQKTPVNGTTPVNNIPSYFTNTDIGTNRPDTSRQSNINRVGNEKGSDVANDYANFADQMSPEQYYSMIDQEAQKSLDYLGQQESAINADKETALANLEKQRASQKESAYTTKEDAQSAARRLYSELQQGYRQRFGGASSAGEAAMALTQNEQQRQMAANNRTYQNALTQIDTSADNAVASAQSEFRNQLLQIAQNRTSVESEKLAARRQALSDLSNKVFQIQQQRETFKQNLQLMQEQARLQNQSTLSSLTTNPTSNLTYNNQSTTASGNQGISNAIGYTSSGLSKNEDLTSQGIYPIQTLIDGRIKYSDGSIR